MDWQRLPVFTFIIKITRPQNLNYSGILVAGITLVIVVTDFIAMQYVANTEIAFVVSENGCLLLYSMRGSVLIIVYIHIFRGLYYGSYKYPREILWMLGVVILLLMMATAFMGYVLPCKWLLGRYCDYKSFFGISSNGDYIVTFWGDSPTLSRFCFTYLLPFVVCSCITFSCSASIW